MSAGKAVARLTKALFAMGVDVLDMSVDQNEGIVLTANGKIRTIAKPHSKYCIELHKDRIYLGIDDCTEDEIESSLKFLIDHSTKLKK